MAQVVSTDNNVVVTNREKALLLKRHALHSKYEKAVALYADTDWVAIYVGIGVN